MSKHQRGFKEDVPVKFLSTFFSLSMLAALNSGCTTVVIDEYRRSNGELAAGDSDVPPTDPFPLRVSGEADPS